MEKKLKRKNNIELIILYTIWKHSIPCPKIVKTEE